MERPLPKKSIGVNDTVYLVESCRRVREVQVWARSGPMYTVRFTDTGGGIRVRGDRLYPTREAALAYVRQKKAAPPQPGYWHNVPLWQC